MSATTRPVPVLQVRAIGTANQVQAVLTAAAQTATAAYLTISRREQPTDDEHNP